MEFEPKLLDKPLMPIEALEWRSDLAQWIRSHIEELTIIHFQVRKKIPDTLSRNEVRDTATVYRQVAAMLSKAEILLWDKSMKDLSLSGRKLFYGYRTSDVLSRQPEIWLKNFDIRSSIPQPESGQVIFGNQAVLLWPDQDCSELQVWEILLPPDYAAKRVPFINGYALSTIYAIPATEEEITEDDNIFLQLISGIEFLKSTIVSSEKESLPRTIRRQIEREGKHEPIVRVIRLRRKEHGQNSDSSGGIDYSCQWLVRPHWRNQYHPSTGERKPVFIDAYIKGPEDKPFKPPKDYVFKVDR